MILCIANGTRYFIWGGQALLGYPKLGPEAGIGFQRFQGFCRNSKLARQGLCFFCETEQRALESRYDRDEVNLQPDPFGLVYAAVELLKLGFHVLPYCTEDWLLCKRLLDAGCEVLMPWAAPIGTSQGPRNPIALRELRKRAPTSR